MRFKVHSVVDLSLCLALFIAALLALAVMVPTITVLSSDVSAVESSQITLRTVSGGILGYIDSGSGVVAVRGKGKAVIGYVDSGATYNKGKKKIAGSRLPGLLFCGKN